MNEINNIQNPTISYNAPQAYVKVNDYTQLPFYGYQNNTTYNNTTYDEAYTLEDQYYDYLAQNNLFERSEYHEIKPTKSNYSISANP
jgi:hypothetical protein